MATDPGKNYSVTSAPFKACGNFSPCRMRGFFRYVFLFLFTTCFLANGAYGYSLNSDECAASVASPKSDASDPYDIEQIVTQNNRIIGADILREAEAHLRALRADDKGKTAFTAPSFGLVDHFAAVFSYYQNPAAMRIISFCAPAPAHDGLSRAPPAV